MTEEEKRRVTRSPALLDILNNLSTLVGKELWRWLMLFRSIPIDWTIIEGVKKVEVYDDDTVTCPFIALHFGEIPQGETRDFTCYVRNDGLVPSDVQLTVVGAPAGATIALTPDFATPVPMAPGESATVEIAVTIAPDAVLEFQSVTLEVSDGQPAPAQLEEDEQ